MQNHRVSLLPVSVAIVLTTVSPLLSFAHDGHNHAEDEGFQTDRWTQPTFPTRLRSTPDTDFSADQSDPLIMSLRDRIYRLERQVQQLKLENKTLKTRLQSLLNSRKMATTR